jgi:hypothetical protein
VSGNGKVTEYGRPAAPTVQIVSGNVELTWDHCEHPHWVGDYVLRDDARISGERPIKVNRFTDTSPEGGGVYMIERAFQGPAKPLLSRTISVAIPPARS